MIIRPIRKSDTKGGFCCGRPALDQFFAKRAWSHEQANVSRAYVLQDDGASDGKPGAILGFYTLAAKSIERERLRDPLPGGLPKYPLPVFYVGFFAVAEHHQGRGWGRRLMADALRRCIEGVQQVGAVGVFLDSLDANSTAFYRSLGFLDIPPEPSRGADSPQPMVLPMSVLLAAGPTSDE